MSGRWSRGGLGRWTQGHSKGAYAFRVIMLTLLAGAVVSFFNAGLVPNRNGSNESGSQTQAEAMGVILVLILVGTLFAKIRRRSRGIPRRSWPFLHPPYDQWFAGNILRPLAVLSVLAELRALAHFSVNRLAGSAQVAVFVAAGLAAVYLFVLGPIWRPQTILTSVAPMIPGGTLPADVRYFGQTSETPTRPTDIGRMTFPTALKGYNVDEVNSFLKKVADRLENGEEVPPSELSQVQFRLGLKGYDVKAVDGYLARLRPSEGV